MENKINIACFKSGSRTAEVKDIWQWDYGQILRIQGLNLPTAVEIHFSLDEHGGEAARRIGVAKDGVADVPIPDSMVENESAYGDSYYFFAYIYLSDEESGNTEYKIRAKVSTRSKPEGFVSGGNDTFAEILKTVNEIAEDKVDIPAPAKVGQVLSVKATDESGKPTEFEATDPIEETDPTVPDWAKNPEKPSYTAEEVGADAGGTAESKVSAHNVSDIAHNDIRLLVQGLTERLNALADSDDETLDQMSEVVAYIKSNKSLIDAITTSKINVSDIIDNLTTNVSNKPLSAAQGVKLKALIDAITTVALDESLTDNTKAAPAGMVGELNRDLSDLDNAVFYQQFEDITSDYYASHPDKSLKILNAIYTELLQDTTGSIVNVYPVKRGDKFRVISVLSGSNYPVAIYLNSDMRMITASAVYPAETSYSVQVNEFEVDNDYPFVLISSRYSDSKQYAVEKAAYKSKIPTKTSELENDADFATRSEIPVMYTHNATENLYDATKSIVGFMNGKDSVDTSNTAYMVSDYIFLAKGSYVIQHDYITSRTGRISYTTYNSDKTPLVFFNQTNLNHTVVEMDEDGYIRFSTYTPQMQKRAMLFAGSEPKTQYVPFAEWTSLNNALAVDNVLWGKKWAVCGDSFTDGGTETVLNDGRYLGKQYTYPYIIGNRQNMEIECFFRGGRTMGYPSDGTFQNSLTCPTSDAYYRNISEDADYITIYLGINDSHHAGGSSGTDGEDVTGVIPIGEVDDTDVSTYCGAYNTVLAWLIENRPFAHIGILVSNGCDTPEYRSVQIAIAKKYGIPYIDLNGDNQTPVMIRSQNQEIAQSVRDMVTRKQAADFDGSKTGTVNLHPNDDAQLYESYFIEDFLRRI